MAQLPFVISTDQAAAIGIGRHALAHKVARGHWKRLLRGIYLTHSGTPSQLDWLRAALLWGGPDSVISGTAGLRMRGVIVPRVQGILTLVPHDRRAHSAGPVRIRRTSCLPEHPQSRNGVRTAAVPRCVVDAGREISSIADTRAVLSTVVQAGWCTVDDVAEELDAGRRSGLALLRRAVAEVKAGAESVAECEAAGILRRAGISDFEQNAEIRDLGGRLIARADFLWRHLRAILEIDGRVWHSSPEAWERTMRRHSALEIAGYSVLHYTPSAMRRDPSRFTDEVRQWLDARESLVGA